MCVAGRYIHFTTTTKPDSVYCVKEKDYTTWWEGNGFRADVLSIEGTKPMPKRFCVTGTGPSVKESDEKDELEDGEQQARFRHEVHPNEMLEIIHRYRPPGGLVCDSTAGCLVTAYACLRLGVYCIVGERQTEGNMLDNSWERLCQAYEFLRDAGLLPVVGVPVAGPQWWEKEGRTWMHEAQRRQQDADNRDARQVEKAAKAKRSRDVHHHEVRRALFLV